MKMMKFLCINYRRLILLCVFSSVSSVCASMTAETFECEGNSSVQKECLKNFLKGIGINDEQDELDCVRFFQWAFQRYVGWDPNELGFQNGHPSCFNTRLINEFGYCLDEGGIYFEHRHDEWRRMNFLRFKNDEKWCEETISQVLSCLKNKCNHVVGYKEIDYRDKLSIKDDLIVDCEKKVYNCQKDSMIYIFDSKSDNFYCMGLAKLTKHHSHLGMGKPVWCAVNICIKNGKITLLTNDSGHYLPHVYHLYTLVKYLNHKNLFAEAEDVIIRAIEFKNNTSLCCSSYNLNQFLASYNEEELRLSWISKANNDFPVELKMLCDFSGENWKELLTNQ